MCVSLISNPAVCNSWKKSCLLCVGRKYQLDNSFRTLDFTSILSVFLLYCTYLQCCLFALDYKLCWFHFYVLFGVLLQGMVESYILSKYELLNPNIDEVMIDWILRRKAQHTKNRRTLDLSILVFNFFPPLAPWRKSVLSILLRSLQVDGRFKIIWVQNGPRQRVNKNCKT